MRKTLELAGRHEAGYASRTISLPGQRKAIKEVSASDLSLIQQFALREVTAEEVKAFELDVCSDQIDRDVEKFNWDILEDFRETLPGKSWLIGHQWGPPGVGRVFRASVEDKNGGRWLTCGVYIPVLGNEKFINDVELGVACYVSIGFYAPDIAQIQGASGSYWEYRRGPNGEKAEAVEVSSVFLGAQYDARITKGILKGLREQAAHPDLHASLAKILAEKSAGGLPFAVHGQLGKAAKDRAWDPDAALKRVRAWASSDGSGAPETIDWAKYVQAFAWRDADRMQALAGYRVLHHDVEQGALVHHYEGSVRAMAALFGRNQADLSEDDRKDVYEHLAAEYGVFDEKAPALDEVEKIRGDLLAATDVDVVGLEAQLGKACRGTSDESTNIVERASAAITKALRDVFGRPGSPAPIPAETTAKTPTDREGEGEMDELKKQITALQEQMAAAVKNVSDLKTVVDAQAATIAEQGKTIAEQKTAIEKLAGVDTKVAALETSVKAVEGELTELAGEKGVIEQTLDRVEVIEAHLSGSKAAETDGDDVPRQRRPKTVKAPENETRAAGSKRVFAGMFAPPEMAGRLRD